MMKAMKAIIFGLIITLANAGGSTIGWKGPSKDFYGGEIHTYVELDPSEKVVEVGIEFTANMLNELPTEPSDGKYDIDDCGETIETWFCCGFELELDFPKQANGRIPFDHFVMNYNPKGHGPTTEGLYAVPHFDMHFYTISTETRLSVQAPDQCYTVNEGIFAGTIIPTTLEDYNYLMMELPCDQIPPAHVYLPAVEPAMGAHMLDPNSPEFNGEPFTHTWIFGRQGGEISFWEPMLTVALLEEIKENREPEGAEIPLPPAAPKAGYYPQEYSISYDPDTDVFRIALVDFRWLKKSKGGSEGCEQPYPPPPPTRALRMGQKSINTY